MRKAFSHEQYGKDDLPAKDAVAKFIQAHWGVDVQEGGRYDVDLVCLWDGEVMSYVEVERRHNWVNEFPYQTVHVPARKDKFFTLDKTTFMFSVRSDLKKAMWCTGKQVMNSKVEFLDNKHCDNEDFFVVPLDQWKLVDL